MDITITNKPDNSDLREVIFENIDDRFAWGLYGGMKLIIEKKTGYINATKLCSDYNKNFYHWLENKKSKELIEEVNKELQIETNNSTNGKPLDEIKPIFKVVGGNINLTIIRGSYVHKLLILDIASWCSSKFYILASKILNEYNVSAYKLLIKQMEERHKESLLTINKFTSDVSNLSSNNNKLNSDIIRLTEDIGNKDSLLFECAVALEEIQISLNNKGLDPYTEIQLSKYKNKYEKAINYLSYEELEYVNYEVPDLRPYKDNMFVMIGAEEIPYYPSNYEHSFIGICFECFNIEKNKDVSWLKILLEDNRLFIEIPNPKNKNYLKLIREGLSDLLGKIKLDDITSYAYTHSINNYILFNMSKITSENKLKNKIIKCVN